MNLIKKILITFLLSLTMSLALAQTESWSQWVHQLRQDAIKDGIKPAVFDRIFSTIHAPSEKVLHYYKTQPERRLTFLEYRHTRANQSRIDLGRHEFEKHKTLLTEIGKRYQVDPCFIMALW